MTVQWKTAVLRLGIAAALVWVGFTNTLNKFLCPPVVPISGWDLINPFAWANYSNAVFGSVLCNTGVGVINFIMIVIGLWVGWKGIKALVGK